MIIRARGLGQTESVSSEIIWPGDPRYIDLYPNIVAGGGITYTTTGTPTDSAGGSAGSPSGTSPLLTQTGTGTGAGGAGGGTSSQPSTGSGPFVGSGGGSGYGPGFGLNLPGLNLNLCPKVFGTGQLGQFICANGIWLLVGGAVLVFLLAVQGRR